MPRKKDLDLQKVTLFLFEGDFAKLRELHPRNGASLIVRKLVRNHIRAVQQRLDMTEQAYKALRTGVPAKIKDKITERIIYPPTIIPEEIE